MAQRRSRNRRLSSRKSNASGFLNEDTNVYDNNDPLWYDRTAVRPSTSLYMSKDTTAVLDADSTVHASQLYENWFENLSHSDSSKQLEPSVKKPTSKHNEEQHESDHVSAATESESEHEFQKKRANLRANKKLSNKSDKSNAFMKALEKTTDSHTRNLTHAQMLEGNESESTHDDSKTIRKLRPRFARRVKNDTNNFDMALESDSASERFETSKRSLRSTSKRISEAKEDFATPEKQQKLRMVSEHIVDTSHGNKTSNKLQNKSANRTKDITITEPSVRELRSRSVVTTPTKSATPRKSAEKSSDTKKRLAKELSPDVSPSSPEVSKQKRRLFSQGNKSNADKSKGDKSAFEAALDSVNDTEQNEATLTETANASKADKQSNIQVDDDDSDSSSIPHNIRRTRSRSFFGQRNSGEVADINTSKNKLKHQEKNTSKNVSKSQKDTSAINETRRSDKQETSPKNFSIVESSDEDDMYNVSYTRSKSTEHERSKKKESVELQISSVGSSDEEDVINLPASKTKQAETNANILSRRSNAKIDKSTISKSIFSVEKEDEIGTSSELSKHKSRSHLFQKKNTSKDENAFDQMSFNESSVAKNKSKEQKIQETPKLSQLSPKAINKSSNSQSINVSKKKSTSRESSRNDSQKDESEDETSTIPQHIRRTRSRLFQKSKVTDDDNAFEDALDAENVPKNRSALSEQSRTLNKSYNKSGSLIRDLATNKTLKPKIILNKFVRSADSNVSSADSQKENFENRQSSPQKSSQESAVTRTQSKEKPVHNSQSHSRSIETSTDGTPVPVSKQSRALNASSSKSGSVIREFATNKTLKPKIILNKIVQPADSIVSSIDSPKKNLKNRQSRQESAGNKSSSKEKSVSTSQSDNRSIETSSDDTSAPMVASTPFPIVLESKSTNRILKKPSPAKSTRNSSFDDLIHTPNPAQSTLNPYGKPVNRITQFSFRIEERTPPTAAVENPKAGPSVSHRKDTDNENVHDDSNVSESPLITRHVDDIPSEKEKTTIDEDVQEASAPSKSPKKIIRTKNSNDNNNDEELSIDWDKIKQHTDAVKLMVDAQMRLAEEARKKRELDKQRIDAKVQRLQAQKEAERKRKNKKPVDKAFLVNGHEYKQPKLPRPKPWATNKLYSYLWKCMEPKFGIRTRIRSEEFVVQLAEFATRISKRKKFENYKNELDEIMITMAKLGIIKTRHDFYRFAVDFMPYSFREKVNPIMMPGNTRIVPYDRELLYKPLLDERDTVDESQDSDDNES